MQIINNKIIIFMRSIYISLISNTEPDNTKIFQDVLGFAQRHTNYTRFTSLLSHLPKGVPSKKLPGILFENLKKLHRLIETSEIAETLHKVSLSQTKEQQDVKQLVVNIFKTQPRLEPKLALTNLYEACEKESLLSEIISEKLTDESSLKFHVHEGTAIQEQILNLLLTALQHRHTKYVDQLITTTLIEYSDLKNLFTLFAEILKNKSTVIKSPAQEYFEVLNLFSEFIKDLYPSLTFPGETQPRLEPNPALTNLYKACEKELLPPAIINEKLTGESIPKSMDTLMIRDFQVHEGTVIQEQILNLLLTALQQNRHIRCLEFSSGACNYNFVSDMLRMLPKTGIEALIFHSISFQSSSKSEFPESGFLILEKNRTITSLKFTECDLPAEYIQQISSALKENNTLMSLHIEDSSDENADENQKKSTAINNLFNVLATKKTFKLSLINFIDSTSIPALCNALAAGLNFTKLDLSRNKLSANDVIAIAKTIITKRVSFSKITNYSPENQKDVESPLVSNETYIEELNLSENNLGSAGCNAIAQAIRVRKLIMKTLKLSSNLITKIGAQALADVLLQDINLKTLHLNDNPIGSAAIDLFNSKVTELSIDIFLSHGIEIAQALGKNRHLTSLTLAVSSHFSSYWDRELFKDEEIPDYAVLQSEFIASLTTSKLTTLKLNTLYVFHEPLVIAAIIANTKSLLDLHTCCDLSPNGLEQIVTALAQSNLKSFSWTTSDGSTSEDTYNLKDSAAILAVLKILEQNTSLTFITFPSIEFTPAHHKFLAGITARNRYLEEGVTPLVKLAQADATAFWKSSKTKFKLPVNYELLKDNMKCFFTVYFVQKTEHWLYTKLSQRSQAQDNSAKLLFSLLEILILNSSKDKNLAKAAETLGNAIKTNPSLAAFIFNQCLSTFKKITGKLQEKLTNLSNDINFIQKQLDTCLASVNESPKFPEQDEKVITKWILQLQSKH